MGRVRGNCVVLYMADTKEGLVQLAFNGVAKIAHPWTVETPEGVVYHPTFDSAKAGFDATVKSMGEPKKPDTVVLTNYTVRTGGYEDRIVIPTAHVIRAGFKDGQRMKITIEPLELSSDPEGSR